MSKNNQWLLIGLSITSLVIAFLICQKSDFSLEEIVKAFAGVIAFNFFMYKLIVGWLFINLTVKIDTERQNTEENLDNLIIKLTLKKGSVDSVWLDKIEIRLSKVLYKKGINEYVPICIIQPLGFKKRNLEKGDNWDGEALPHYVISANEEVPFAAFAQVQRSTIIAVEVLVLATRPFTVLNLKRRN